MDGEPSAASSRLDQAYQVVDTFSWFKPGWHGEHDMFVPIAHGRWLSERIPNVDARLSSDDGHLTLATRRMPEVHGWLVERLQA